MPPVSRLQSALVENKVQNVGSHSRIAPGQPCHRSAWSAPRRGAAARATNAWRDGTFAAVQLLHFTQLPLHLKKWEECGRLRGVRGSSLPAPCAHISTVRASFCQFILKVYPSLWACRLSPHGSPTYTFSPRELLHTACARPCPSPHARTAAWSVVLPPVGCLPVPNSP